MTADPDASGRHGASGNRGVSAAYHLLGALATVVALGGIAAAILLDPTFSWVGDALSDLGVRDRSAPIFNGGLILGGLAGIGYAVGLWRVATGGGDGDGIVAVGQLRAVVFAVAMVAMAGVGLYDLTHPLHGPAAIGFYTLVTATFAVDGLARRHVATGRITLAFVPVHVTVWVTFLVGFWPVTGLALPELPGALMLAAWVWFVGPLPVVDAFRRESATDESATDEPPTDEH